MAPKILFGIVGLLAFTFAAAAEEKVLTVSQSGGDFTTIQKAIDAAPQGATVRISPGKWEENLVINKPIVLQGAGWQQATIHGKIRTPDELKKAVAEVNEKLKQVKTRDEARKLYEDFREQYLQPVIQLSGTKGVVISGLKITGTLLPQEDRSPLSLMTLIKTDKTQATIQDCAINGSCGNGIEITGGSDVTVNHCLVAGVWATGMILGDGSPTKALISDCDIRTCYYAGIRIVRNADATVKDCRISDTAWHGIRYDNVSPTINHNRIADVARSGIYASGNTQAKLTKNLLLGNEMDGISCWIANHDLVEGNTFAHNKRDGLLVVGGAEPLVVNNKFIDNPVAINCTKISGDKTNTVGNPKLEGNVFWKNGQLMKKVEGDVSKPVDLPPESKSKMQAVEVNDDFPKSAYPLQPEETAIRPDAGSRDYRRWKKS